MHKCSRCRKYKIRNYVKTYGIGRKHYTDNTGSAWTSPNVRPDCGKIRRNTVYSRAEGHVPRNLIKETKNKVGYESEVYVKTYFESLGYTVDQVNVFGSDLVVRSPFQIFSIEVKTASLKTGRKAYQTSIIWPTRKNDDLVAVVFPNGYVLIETMPQYISQCGKSGKRYFPEVLNG